MSAHSYYRGTKKTALSLGLLFLLAGCSDKTEELPAPTPPNPVIAERDVKPVQLLPEEQEDIMQDKLRKANRIDGCDVTYYCCEKRPHICGTGDGITASGVPVQAGVSCAVDPLFIPLGSTVWVDYGDGELHEYIAQDVGGAISGAHIDLAVETHDEALQLGRQTATVYWKENK